VALPKIHGTIVVTAGTNDTIRVDQSGAPAAADLTLTAGTYFPIALATEIQTQLNAYLTLGVVGTVTVADATGLFTIAVDTGTIDILWTHGNTNFGVEIGFDVSADDTGSASYASDNQHQRGWYSLVPPAWDVDARDYVETNTEAIDGTNVNRLWTTKNRRTVRFEFLTAAKTWIADEALNGALENLWATAAYKSRFRYFPDQTVNGTSTDYFLTGAVSARFAPDRMFVKPEFYRITLELSEYQT